MAASFLTKPRKKLIIQTVGVGILATILHLALSYPTVLHFKDSVPGGMSDGINAIGHVWLLYYNVFQGHGDFAFTRMAYYPAGIVFGIRPVLFWYALFDYLATFVYGNLCFWYNTNLVASSALTAMGVYVLAWRLTRSGLAALLAAIMFTFSPRRMDILYGQINYYSTEFLVWCTVAFQSALRKPTRIYPWVIAGIFWGLQVWQAPDMMVLIGFIWVPLALWWWWEAWVDHVKERPVPRSLWAPFIAPSMAAFSLLPVILLVLPYMHMRLGSDQVPWPRTHWFEFFYPSARHLFYSPWRRFIEERIYNPGHNEAFAGFAGILGVLVFLAVGGIRSRRFRPWLILSVLFLVLTLGTTVSLFGAIDIPLPYRLMLHMPVLKELRIPGRFNTLFSLGIALMAAVGWTIYRRKQLPWARILFGTLVALALLDGCFAPVTYTKVRDDPNYYPMRLLNEIRQDPNHEVSVLVVPVGTPAILSGAQQMIHEHPIYDGFDPRLRQEQIEQLALGPIQYLWEIEQHPSVQAAQEKMAREKMSVEEFHARLRQLRLKYVLLRHTPDPRAEVQEQIIRQFLPIQREERDGQWTMFVLH